MPNITRRTFMPLLAAAPASLRAFAQDFSGWIPLFDGHSLEGWKARESASSFRPVDGQIVAQGPRALLFYAGPVRGADFKNFELNLEAMLETGARSSIRFHTAPHAPETGLEILLANHFRGPNGYMENRKTGSLFGLRNVYKPFVKDGEWFRIHLLVRQKQVQVRMQCEYGVMVVVDYIEPDPPFIADPANPRVLSHGTFALEAYGPESAARFRNIQVRPLSDEMPQLSDYKPVVDEVYKDIIRLSNTNIPLVDSHAHLKGGLTIDQAMTNSHRVGIFYGVAINGGIQQTVKDDAGLRGYVDSMKGQPCYVALQCEGREWRSCFTPQAVSLFDYIFTDAMTFSDDSGKRMRIWMPEEVGVIHDPQAFMDMLVNRIEHILEEPVDIYANPTYIPDQIGAQYDELWTEPRMKRVIHAALKNNVAIEINNRRRIPSKRFILLAKAAGCTFSFGTNNGEAEQGRLEYPIQMVKECGLTWEHMFVPKPDGKKAVQVKSWGVPLSPGT